MRTLWPVLAAALGLALTGCGGQDAPTTAPSAQPTAIGQLDSPTMRAVRAAFCDLVPRSAIHAALAGPPTRMQSWHNGDRLPGAGGQISTSSAAPGSALTVAWPGPGCSPGRSLLRSPGP